MNTRLKQFLAAENISQAQFADTIKVVRASVSHVIAGRNKPGYDFIKAIITAYPNLNIEWLLAGKGRMYKSASDFDDSVHTEVTGQIRDSQADEAPLLFDCVEEEEYPTSTPAETLRPSVAATDRRRAVKVVIFFSDGTYQEMQY